MCVNCLNNTEAAVAGVVFVSYALKPPVHRMLARWGLANQPDPVAHDVTTIAFLRSLDLDPVAILGPDTVASAERWTPAQPVRVWEVVRDALSAASARPIGSQSLHSPQ